MRGRSRSGPSAAIAARGRAAGEARPRAQSYRDPRNAAAGSCRQLSQGRPPARRSLNHTEMSVGAHPLRGRRVVQRLRARRQAPEFSPVKRSCFLSAHFRLTLEVGRSVPRAGMPVIGWRARQPLWMRAWVRSGGGTRRGWCPGSPPRPARRPPAAGRRPVAEPGSSTYRWPRRAPGGAGGPALRRRGAGPVRGAGCQQWGTPGTAWNAPAPSTNGAKVQDDPTPVVRPPWFTYVVWYQTLPAVPT